MSIKFGTTPINRIYFGSTEIKKVYWGETELYTAGASLDLLYSATSVTDSLLTYTFEDVPLGTAKPTRQILVTVSGYSVGSANPPTSVSIGGVTVSTPLYHATVNQFTNYPFVAFYVATVPTGTMGDVLVNFPTTHWRQCTVGVYAFSGTPTVHDSFADNVLSSGVLNGVIDIPAGGVLVAGGFSSGSSDTNFNTWVGLSETYDIQVTDGGGVIANAGAAQAYADTQTNMPVSVTLGGSGVVLQIMAAISLGP